MLQIVCDSVRCECFKRIWVNISNKRFIPGVTSAVKCAGCAHVILLWCYPSRTAQTLCVHCFATSPHHPAFDIGNFQFFLPRLLPNFHSCPIAKEEVVICSCDNLRHHEDVRGVAQMPQPLSLYELIVALVGKHLPPLLTLIIPPRAP
eukprot:UN03998